LPCLSPLRSAMLRASARCCEMKNIGKNERKSRSITPKFDSVVIAAPHHAPWSSMATRPRGCGPSEIAGLLLFSPAIKSALPVNIAPMACQALVHPTGTPNIFLRMLQGDIMPEKKYTYNGKIVRRSERKYTHTIIYLSELSGAYRLSGYCCGSYELAVKAARSREVQFNCKQGEKITIVELEVAA